MMFFGLGALFGHLLYICSQGSGLDLLPCFGVALLIVVEFCVFAWLINLLFVRRY